ncbi:hypothetical protein [Aurantibacter sp.]|uniref:hypothetical protein n=1 Tax=Aurantibacter sp. TaxID=2807103 RepID=UPI003264DF94
MNHFNILISIFLGVIFVSNAQTYNTNNKLLAGGIHPEVIAKEVGPNTVVYSYPQKTHQNEGQNHENNGSLNSNDKTEFFEYPDMKTKQGAILPFEFIFDGSIKSQAGIKAQEFYFSTLMKSPELNKISYQDLETTRERLNRAGIFDAQDLNYFDLPLIAKIIGAGILITAKISINTTNTDVPNQSPNTEIAQFQTETNFSIYNKNGKEIFSKKEAPFTPGPKDSYQITLDYLMKQTPYYHKL